MFNLRLITLSGVALLVGATAAMAGNVSVDLSTVANGAWCNADGIAMFGCSTLPTGMQTFNGTLFDIAGANGGNNAWFSSVAANNGAGTVSVTIPVNVVGATAVNTLMNTFWGQSGTSDDLITFTGSGGLSYSVSLTGNSSVRDYNNYIWTNSVTLPTQMAWTNGSQRLDEQTFALPSSFANQTLESITITDSGNMVSSRLFLAGLTIDPSSPASVPEPASLALVGGGLLVAGLLFRRRRSS